MPEHAFTSLRRRLTLALAWPMAAVLALALVAEWHQARQLSDEAYDQALRNVAVALGARIEFDPDEDLHLDLPASAQALMHTDGQDEIRLAVFNERGQLTWGEAGLLACAGPPGAQTRECLGQRMRVLSHEHQGRQARARIVVAETTHKRDSALRGMLARSLGLGVALWAVAMLALHGVARRVTAPLTQVAEAIHRRDENDLRPLPAPGAFAELRELTQAMNGLFARLSALAGAQREFVADMAHQLRTPLAQLGLQLDLLAQGLPAENKAPQPTPRLEERLAWMNAARARMERLIGQLLALARANAEPGLLQPVSPVDLAQVAERCVDEFLPQAQVLNVDLGFELAPAPLQGREGDMHELLSNLIDNALRHGGAGGCVTVRTGQADGHAFLEVEDNGPGLPPERCERLFQRHVRGTTSGGSGLGLAIVAAIVAQHGGHLSCEPVHPGTRVRVRFPSAF